MQKRVFPDVTELIENHYKIENTTLGQGYFAIVRLGKDLKTGENVAIKMIDKEKVEKEKTLVNEIEILGSISHPNIVNMLAMFETNETLFIVMELMNGGELYDEIIRCDVFTETQASFIMHQLFEALVYLHSKGVVHRDLKLENLLLKQKGSLEVKVADFGLSKLFGEGSMAHTACGTPFYVSPEILLAEDEGYGAEVDMWASGILLYILLSGRLPFSGDSDEELFSNILECELEWKTPQFDNVSDEAKDLISRLIIPDPEDRLTAEEALQHPFIQGESKKVALHTLVKEGIQEMHTQSRLKMSENSKKT